MTKIERDRNNITLDCDVLIIMMEMMWSNNTEIFCVHVINDHVIEI